jgi:hypothetical protein
LSHYGVRFCQICQGLQRSYSCLNQKAEDKHLWIRSLPKAFFAILVWIQCGTALASEQSPQQRAPSRPPMLTMPIFNQIILLTQPGGFKVVHQQTSPQNYIFEMVPASESKERWSQMVGIMGIRGLAANAEFTPQKFAERIATGFRQTCPQTFAAKGLGNLKIGEHDAYVALIGCGRHRASGYETSEVVMLLAIRGSENFYSVQWAERKQPTDQQPVLDERVWRTRLNLLQPIRLCQRIPNEPPPFASCLNQRN